MHDEVWRLAYGAIGLLVGLLLFVVLVGASREVPTIICPPFMDKALYEIKLTYVLYEPDAGPEEYTEVGLEFIEACGYTVIHDPIRIEPSEPPPPEEGGA